MHRNGTGNDEDGQENCHTSHLLAPLFLLGAAVAIFRGAHAGGGLVSDSPIYTTMSRLLRKATPLSAWYDTAVSEHLAGRTYAGQRVRTPSGPSLSLSLSPSPSLSLVPAVWGSLRVCWLPPWLSCTHKPFAPASVSARALLCPSENQRLHDARRGDPDPYISRALLRRLPRCTRPSEAAACSAPTRLCATSRATRTSCELVARLPPATRPAGPLRRLIRRSLDPQLVQEKAER
eukprot:COSAG02_NODE_5895_length_3956_cov_1.928442_3_plen_234_part_00